MGPRPDGRGRRYPGCVLLYLADRLQWGRGRMAAEGRDQPLLVELDVALQWGRGRMAAEGGA